MARKGYRSFSVKDDVYAKLEKKAEKENLSISKTIEQLLKGVC